MDKQIQLSRWPEEKVELASVCNVKEEESRRKIRTCARARLLASLEIAGPIDSPPRGVGTRPPVGSIVDSTSGQRKH